MKKNDLKGNVYGRLTVLGDDGTRTKTSKVLWRCRCDCGNEVHILGSNLKRGATKSCGCLNSEKRRERFKDLAGTETENFKIIDKAYSKNQRVWWNCICKHCGRSVILNNNLIDHQASCGCRRGASKDYMDAIRDSESLKTTRPTAKSTTGVRGVYFNKRKGSYQAFINVDKKPKYLGSSKSFEKAVALRKEAEEEYGYHNKK